MKWFVLMLLAMCNMGAWAQSVRPSVLEYWFDQNYQSHQRIATNGTLDMALDVSHLCPGIHTLGMRIGDTKGRWGVPLLRYFLKVRPKFPGNKVVTFQYWIDNDISRTVTSPLSGEATFDIDVSQLCRGIHTLSYLVTDGRGMTSAPRMTYFLIPTLPPTGITAYEYWFNHGERTRVEVSPQNPLALEDVVIEVRDVTPHEIPADYRFDAEAERVYCNDKVTFNLLVVDDLGHRSMPTPTDTFDMAVPVNPNFQTIQNGDETVVPALPSGVMQGFRAECTPEDTLYWTVGGGRQEFDLYESDGTRAEVVVKELPTGERVFAVVAKTSRIYALCYNATGVVYETQVALSVVRPDGIGEIPNGFRITGITDATGRQYSSRGQSVSGLPSGVYIVHLSDGTRTIVRKVAVKR